MTSITIIGHGNIGQAIEDVARAGGHDVQVLGPDATDTPVTGDIVVLAVPYGAVAGITDARQGELAGKVVVDITNPVDFESFDSLVVPADSSAAAEIAARCPRPGS